MQKGFGITALVIAILSIFIPVAGPWLTIVAGALGAFAYSLGFPLGLSAIIINLINIFFLSPTIWLVMGVNAAAEANGHHSLVSVGTILFIVQAIALGVLVTLHGKGKKRALAT